MTELWRAVDALIDQYIKSYEEQALANVGEDDKFAFAMKQQAQALRTLRPRVQVTYKRMVDGDA